MSHSYEIAFLDKSHEGIKYCPEQMFKPKIIICEETKPLFIYSIICSTQTTKKL